MRFLRHLGVAFLGLAVAFSVALLPVFGNDHDLEWATLIIFSGLAIVSWLADRSGRRSLPRLTRA
ncbi:MAG: hypothetical protein O7D35_11130 [Acidobacteria bacterium]|nr:hypothetical protein [Acidobacteriota bacterium]